MTEPDDEDLLVTIETAGLALTVMVLMWRMFVFYDKKNEDRIDRLDAKNEAAHASIGENVKAVEEHAERRADRLEERAERRADRLEERAERRADRLEAAVSSIAQDVSKLVGRQAERDRTAPLPAGPPDE